jgi:hypothetical protein
MIMDMYTDWGNLKVVNCVAWLKGPDPAVQRSTNGMGALGASISALMLQVGRRRAGDGEARLASGRPIGRSGKHQVL